MNIFQRQQIEGNVYINDTISGTFPYKFKETLDAGWDDVNTIAEIHAHGHLAGADFHQRHLYIKDLTTTLGFATLSTAVKDVVGLYRATDDSSLVTHYATTQTAGDILAALEIHAGFIGMYVVELQTVALYRADHPNTIKAVMQYIKNIAFIEAFTAAIRNFMIDYRSRLHLGTQYNDTTDGIADYLEGTGGYSEAGTGLDSYEFSDLYKQVWYTTNAVDPANPTLTEEQLAHDYVRDLLKVTLINILVYGIID